MAESVNLKLDPQKLYGGDYFFFLLLFSGAKKAIFQCFP